MPVSGDTWKQAEIKDVIMSNKTVGLIFLIWYHFSFSYALFTFSRSVFSTSAGDPFANNCLNWLR